MKPLKKKKATKTVGVEDVEEQIEIEFEIR